ncbi:unnamed protein product, partial [Urochloa humidicola]
LYQSLSFPSVLGSRVIRRRRRPSSSLFSTRIERAATRGVFLPVPGHSVRRPRTLPLLQPAPPIHESRVAGIIHLLLRRRQHRIQHQIEIEAVVLGSRAPGHIRRAGQSLSVAPKREQWRRGPATTRRAGPAGGAQGSAAAPRFRDARSRYYPFVHFSFFFLLSELTN